MSWERRDFPMILFLFREKIIFLVFLKGRKDREGKGEEEWRQRQNGERKPGSTVLPISRVEGVIRGDSECE